MEVRKIIKNSTRVCSALSFPKQPMGYALNFQVLIKYYYKITQSQTRPNYSCLILTVIFVQLLYYYTFFFFFLIILYSYTTTLLHDTWMNHEPILPRHNEPVLGIKYNYNILWKLGISCHFFWQEYIVKRYKIRNFQSKLKRIRNFHIYW